MPKVVPITKKSKTMDSILADSKETASKISYGLQGRKNNLGKKNEEERTVQSPKLQNIVSTVNLNCPLNLKNIALHARNAEYNPRRFAAVVMRLRSPKTTALIFASGKMVCTGAKNEDASRIAARKFARIIQKLGNPVQFTSFKIQNVVGSCDVGFSIDLEQLANKHNEYCSYEPEVFPGLVYRMMDPKLVLLIFVSGKIVLTGAKRKVDIDTAFNIIYPYLVNDKKKQIQDSQSDFLQLTLKLLI